MLFHLFGTMSAELARSPHGATVLRVGKRRRSSESQAGSQKCGREESAISGHGNFPFSTIGDFFDRYARIPAPSDHWRNDMTTAAPDPSGVMLQPLPESEERKEYQTDDDQAGDVSHGIHESALCMS
jgi:hypothetical protein